MAYYKEIQAKYNQKRLQYKCTYSLSDISDGLRLKAYLSDTNQSANSYIKALIKQDLDSKGIKYPDDNDNSKGM